MRYSQPSVTRAVIIGRVGENEVTTVKFPVADWYELFGTDGTFSLLHQRVSDETPYPCVVTADEEFVYWVIKSADVAEKGIGRCELIYLIDEKVAKSAIFQTNTLEALTGGSDEPPEPYQDWVDSVLEAANDAEESAENSEAWAVGQRGGEDVDEDDPTYHNNAKYYASIMKIPKEIFNPATNKSNYTSSELNTMYRLGETFTFSNRTVLLMSFSGSPLQAKAYYFETGNSTIQVYCVGITNEATLFYPSFAQNKFTERNFTQALEQRLNSIRAKDVYVDGQSVVDSNGIAQITTHGADIVEIKSAQSGNYSKYTALELRELFKTTRLSYNGQLITTAYYSNSQIFLGMDWLVSSTGAYNNAKFGKQYVVVGSDKFIYTPDSNNNYSDENFTAILKDKLNSINFYTSLSNTNKGASMADLEAGNVDFDGTKTYSADTVGSELKGLQSQIDTIIAKSDVTDVVNTYEQLIAYSRPLFVGDIIKVLSDSTHNNARSYYRYISTSAPNWEYIGSEGISYTKAETDELLAEKIDLPENPATNDVLTFDGTHWTAGAVVGGEQSDWNENDTDSLAYVKNRTHYLTLRTELVDSSWDGDFDSENAPELVVSYTDSTQYDKKIYKLSDDLEITSGGYNFDASTLKQKCSKTLVTPVTGIYTVYELVIALVDSAIAAGVLPEEDREVTITEYANQITTVGSETISEGNAELVYFGLDTDLLTFSSQLLYVLNDGEYEIDNEGIHSYTRGIYAISYDRHTTGTSPLVCTPIVSETVVPLDEQFIPTETKRKINNLDLRLTAEENKVLDISMNRNSSTGNIEFYRFGTSEKLKYSDIFAAWAGNKSMRLIDAANIFYPSIGIKKKYEVQLVTIDEVTRAITLNIVGVSETKILVNEFTVNRPFDEGKEETIITSNIYAYAPNTSIIGTGGTVNKLATMKDLSAGNVTFDGSQTYGNGTVGKEITELKSNITEKLDSNLAKTTATSSNKIITEADLEEVIGNVEELLGSGVIE